MFRTVFKFVSSSNFQDFKIMLNLDLIKLCNICPKKIGKEGSLQHVTTRASFWVVFCMYLLSGSKFDGVYYKKFLEETI